MKKYFAILFLLAACSYKNYNQTQAYSSYSHAINDTTVLFEVNKQVNDYTWYNGHKYHYKKDSLVFSDTLNVINSGNFKDSMKFIIFEDIKYHNKSILIDKYVQDNNLHEFIKHITKKL